MINILKPYIIIKDQPCYLTILVDNNNEVENNTSQPVYYEWHTSPDSLDKFQVGDKENKINIGSGPMDEYIWWCRHYIGFNAARTGNEWTFHSTGANDGGAAILTNAFGNMYFINVPSTGSPNVRTLTNTEMAAQAKMTVLSNGNVGIGTSNPAGKLEISEGGNILLSSPYADPGDIIFTDYSGQKGRIWANIGYIKGLNISSGDNIPDIQITAAGNVGIGTDNNFLSAKLTVNGKIDCEKIEVLNVGSDFVFNDNYKLRSILEVEIYIRTNKHLPDIPPASVTEKGVDLGEFTEILLQKIEELTLYIIELNKQITEQKLQIQLLQQEVNELKNK